ncbi:hypothetical protein [Mycolicibacterium sp.]|uniref:hypothetical protein n=1 Tax=Mycolicibacterium sp. TaxID=2320850 RepID=UPI0037C85360
MRAIEEIDADLLVLVMIRQVCARSGRPLRSTSRIDELLDERLQVDNVGGRGHQCAGGV